VELAGQTGVNPQTWAHGAEVLQYLFAESHCRKLKGNQHSFLGCDGVIYSVQGNDVLLHLTKREPSPWLRCHLADNSELFSTEDARRVYPIVDVENWQYEISLELERLSRDGCNAISQEQFDLARNDARTLSVSLNSLNLEPYGKDRSELTFSLPDFPAGLSGAQLMFLERALGSTDVINAVRYERGEDWKCVVISFPSKSKIAADLERARSYGAEIPAIGYGFGIGIERRHSNMNVDLQTADLYNIPFSVIGTAWKSAKMKSRK